MGYEVGGISHETETKGISLWNQNKGISHESETKGISPCETKT